MGREQTKHYQFYPFINLGQFRLHGVADAALRKELEGYTFFTEVGGVFPTDVHLQTTRLTGRRVRGGLVDGPVREPIFKSLRGVSITEPDPLAGFQDPRAVYHNDFQDYATNEPTMDGTAAAALLWSLGVADR